MIERSQKGIKKSPLIVALDVRTLAEVRSLVEALSDCVDIFKVGSQLFTSCGPAAVRYIEATGKDVFLDLKFHDIPNTVAASVESAVNLCVALERSTDYWKRVKGEHRGLFMFTLHTSGGREMMEAAVKASAKTAETVGLAKPLLVGVTVLTSEAKGDNISELVLERTRLAKESGCDGVVASSQEAALIRKEFGKNFVIVTPGIRPAGEAVGDQKRVMTPREAIMNGSDYLVVGRPIVKAANPREAAKKICKEIEGVV